MDAQQRDGADSICRKLHDSGKWPETDRATHRNENSMRGGSVGGGGKSDPTLTRPHPYL